MGLLPLLRVSHEIQMLRQQSDGSLRTGVLGLLRIPAIPSSHERHTAWWHVNVTNIGGVATVAKVDYPPAFEEGLQQVAVCCHILLALELGSGIAISPCELMTTLNLANQRGSFRACYHPSPVASRSMVENHIHCCLLVPFSVPRLYSFFGLGPHCEV